MKARFLFFCFLFSITSFSAYAETPESILEEYWDCRESTDLQRIIELVEYHNTVSRIDARMYGLPENDFDDQKPLSIEERLLIRRMARETGHELPTSGPMQYPREIRHALRDYYKEKGIGTDCADILDRLPPDDLQRTLAEDGIEVKVHEDSSGDNEANITVNPYNPQYIVATSNDYSGASGNDLYYSSTWGNSWTTSDVPHSGSICDPVSYYTHTNNNDVVYHSYLNVWFFGASVQMKYSTNNGVSWNSCAQIASSGDRQDHAIDTDPNSGCFNTIYLAYQNGQQYLHHSTGATFPYCQSWSSAYSTSGVSNTIGSAIVISATFDQPPGTNAIAHNFFTQYGSPGGVYESRSSNCGSTWTTTKRWSINLPGTFEWGIPSTCSRKVYYYPQADSDRQQQSQFRNNIYVVWNDLNSDCTPPGCSDNTTCNNDIFFGRAIPNDRDNPTSWTFDDKVNLTEPGGLLSSDAYTDEFYPSLTVDQADGAVYISFYRTGSGSSSITPRKTQVHHYVAKSINGGATWSLHQVTDLPTDESGSGADLGMQWGDYAWNDVINGVCYPVWTDRREGADEDVWVAKVCSEPSHWSERAPLYRIPGTYAQAVGNLVIRVTWNMPDLYWGDGDENPSARKYRLFVDGSPYNNNISWTDTSFDYIASDSTTPHDFQIVAVNQCGISKWYAIAADVTAVGNVPDLSSDAVILIVCLLSIGIVLGSRLKAKKAKSRVND